MRGSFLRIIIMVSVILFFAVSVSSLVLSYDGGGKNTGGKPHGAMMERMKGELGLTDAQVKQLSSYMEKAREERKAKMGEMSARIRTVLTPEQQKLWDGKMAERKGKMKEPGKTSAGPKVCPAGRENCKGGKDSRGFMSDINLTDAQKAKIRSIQSEEKAKSMALKESRDKELQKILTPEQYKKYEGMKKEHHGKRGMHNRGDKGNPNASPDLPNKDMK